MSKEKEKSDLILPPAWVQAREAKAKAKTEAEAKAKEASWGTAPSNRKESSKPRTGWSLINRYEKFWAEAPPHAERTPEIKAKLAEEDKRLFGDLFEGPGAELFHVWCQGTNPLDTSPKLNCDNFHSSYERRGQGLRDLEQHSSQISKHSYLAPIYNKAKADHARVRCPLCGYQQRPVYHWLTPHEEDSR